MPDPHAGIFEDSPWPAFPIERSLSVAVPFTQNGAQSIQESANASVSGSSLMLPGNTGRAEYGLYRFSTNGDPLISLAVSRSGPPSAAYYLGIADYGSFRWRISGPIFSSFHEVDLAEGNYNSPGNNFYVFVAAFGGPVVTLQSLTLQVDSTLPVYSISGTVLEGGNPLSGVLMTLAGDAGGSVITDAQGSYSFSGLVDGNYTITPSKSQTAFTPAMHSVALNGGNQTGINFTATPSAPVFTVAGRVIEGPAGLTGVTLTLQPGGLTAATDAGGNYSINAVANGSYTLTASRDGYQFTPPSRSVTVNNADVTGQDFLGQAQGVPVTYETGLGQIKQLVGVNGAKCSPCHVSQNPPDGGVRFNTYANITATGVGGQPVYMRIKARAVDTSQMPPTNPKLTADEKQLILDWINAGAPQ